MPSVGTASPSKPGTQPATAAVVTVSDGVARGVRDDASGRAVASLLESSGFQVAVREVVPDEVDQIAALLRRLRDRGIPLVVSTGGTGLGPRDVTPEATRTVIDRDAPGLAEEMRAAGRGSTPFAALSRGVAGMAGATLIVNVPGSERGAVESLTAILPALPHALDLLAGNTAHAGPHASGEGHAHDHERGRSLEEEVAARQAAGEAVVVATAVSVQGDPPCRVGQKMLLGPNGALAGTLGCAEFDDAAVKDAPDVLAAGGPSTRTYTHDLGSIEVFLEPVARRPLLLVFSATPVAAALLRWGRDLGFESVLVESRGDRVTMAHRAVARVIGDVGEVAVDADTMAVHTDHDAPGVADSVAALLRSSARFVGVMGSTRHVGPHMAALREMGFSDQDLARIRTPVGMDLGARSAEEIALSILAGLVAERHGAGGGWLDRRPPVQ
jgi:molybdopterin adenylyltransferase